MTSADYPPRLINLLLDAYAQGAFPMADARDDADTYWVDPPMRGIIPLDTFQCPRSLKKFIKTCNYNITFDNAFHAVIAACANVPRGDGQGTWINQEIEHWFNALHDAGHAHSVEVWDNDGDLVGGLYGLAQGGCFNGESMFSTKTNASKMAMVALVERLKSRGFTVLDTQFINDHLKQFGCIEIPKDDYLQMLATALNQTDVAFS